jgi:hypothetical protein
MAAGHAGPLDEEIESVRGGTRFTYGPLKIIN